MAASQIAVSGYVNVRQISVQVKFDLWVSLRVCHRQAGITRREKHRFGASKIAALNMAAGYGLLIATDLSLLFEDEALAIAAREQFFAAGLTPQASGGG